ncbi:MAG: hypothetical protein RLZZ229_412 [Actinomycetota bacterium]|jgi:eukaryotic-like serine/threonine-protein kinase
MSNLIGTIIADRYRVDELVASGGMASVFVAFDTRLERNVAIKLIHPHLAQDPSFRDKFIQEARIAARVSHPNLVNVFDQGEQDGQLFLAMEYVQGITLRDALKDFGALGANRALDLFEQILLGLGAAHSAGILHRDLKPENVLLADDGRIKLGDFGLAREIDNRTGTGALVGTVAYLSPELITRGIADARSDVYAAGIMLFELLTGRQPFEGEQAVQVAYQHANETVPAPSKINQQVPAVVDQLVLWATAKDQTERPSDANELLVAVKQIKADLRAGTATINIPKPSTAAPEAIAATTVLGDLTNATQVFPSNATQVFPSNANQTEALGFEANATQVLGNLEYSTEADQSVSRSNFGTPRRGLKLLIAMIVVALLGSATGWYFGSGPGGFKAIPNLSSRSVSDARAALTPFGAEVQVIREASSLTSKDLVIRTEPGAGSLYFTGPIKLIVSSGPKSMSVPNLKGMDVATATAKLLTSGFALGTVSSWFSTSPAGQVYDYLGADGSSVPEGTAIELKVSLGSIPVVAGLDQALAIGMIQAAGLKVSKVSQEFSDTVASGQVISVLPISEPLGAGGEVNLIVSKGPNVVLMPAVIGETLAAAKSALESLGLTVVVDTNQLQSKWGIAKVKRVSVAAGTALKSGDQVTIYSK